MGLISRVSSRTYRKKQHANLRPRRGHPRRLRYPGGGHHPDRAPSARWRPKAKEEGLHHAKEDQAQASEGQARDAQALQGRRCWQARAKAQGVPKRNLRRRYLLLQPQGPYVLRQVPSHSQVRREEINNNLKLVPIVSLTR